MSHKCRHNLESAQPKRRAAVTAGSLQPRGDGACDEV